MLYELSWRIAPSGRRQRPPSARRITHEHPIAFCKTASAVARFPPAHGGDKLWDLSVNDLLAGFCGVLLLREWRLGGCPAARRRTLAPPARLLISRFSGRFRYRPWGRPGPPTVSRWIFRA